MSSRLRISLLVPLLIAAQPGTRSRVATGLDAIQASDMRANLTFLSSDALEGRLSLARGSEVAIQWIASEFTKAGLKPIADGTYLQPVPLIEYHPDREASSLTIEQGGAKKTLHFPDAFGNFPHDLTISGPVIFAGYGITAPELHYDDYAGLDARGAIVLVFDHEPQEDDPKSIFNGTGNTRYATSRVKLLTAQKHGAVALLVVAEPNRKHPSNQERAARIPSTQQRAAGIAPQAIEGDEVEFLCSRSAIRLQWICSRRQAKSQANCKRRSIAICDRHPWRFQARWRKCALLPGKRAGPPRPMWSA
jgi:PA domain